MSDQLRPDDRTSDAFDALRADISPIDPDARFAARLRQQLVDALAELDPRGAPVTTTETTQTTRPPTVPDAAAAAANTVAPYLFVDGAAAAIDFYVAAFGAIEHHRLVGDDGRVGHAEIVIGTSRLMLADEHPEFGVLSPTTRGGTSTSFTIEVADVDRTVARAVELGATVVRPVTDEFYGMRTGTVRDPFGHQWNVGHPIAGFDRAAYLANSEAMGYRVVEPASSDVAGEPHHGQVKRYDAGDLYYFTLPVRDLARAQQFYATVLGWSFGDADNGHVSNISAPPGGLDVSGGPGARLWFVVDDIHAAVERVRAAGGTADEPVLHPSGWSADCVDDQGTTFSLSIPADQYRI